MFITNLSMICDSQRSKTSVSGAVEFVNIPSDLLQTGATINDQTDLIVADTRTKHDRAVIDANANGQELSGQDDEDLQEIMSDFDAIVEDADAFVQRLDQDLSVLDGANVQSIMASEQQMLALMNVVQSAIDEMDSVEKRLNVYDQTLESAQRRLQEMDGEKSKLHLTQRNQQRLLDTMEALLPELTHRQRQVLSQPNLTTEDGLREACGAAEVLRRLSTASQGTAAGHLSRMVAAVEQTRMLDKLRTRFSGSIAHHICNLLVHMGNDAAVVNNGLMLPDHSSIYRQLSAYTELVHWAKAVEPKTYNVLVEKYEEVIRKRYAHELSSLFSVASCHITASSRRESLPESSSSSSPASSSATAAGGTLPREKTSTLARAPSHSRHHHHQRQSSLSSARPQGIVLLASDSEAWTGMDSSMRLKFASVLTQIVTDLDQLYHSEQAFCKEFFLLDSADPSTPASNRGDGGEPTGEDTMSTTPSVTSSHTTSTGGVTADGVNTAGGGVVDGGGEGGCRLRTLITTVFSCVESELDSFVAKHDSLDPFCSMHVPVCLSVRVAAGSGPPPSAVSPSNSNNSSSQPDIAAALFHQTLVSVLLNGKRAFDRLMKSQMDSIEGYSAPKRPRCGLLPIVVNFKELVKIAEAVFGNTARHADWQRWCIRLLRAIVDKVTYIGEVHHKSPLQVVQMENFHHLHAVLMTIKMSGMENERKMLKRIYSDALMAYVARYLAQPLIKLNHFFDGVQQCVASGVRESEVGYQLAFSKQQLKKLIREYNGKEVKKGLETLYKKVSKHLCEEENLHQVVWRAMQEEFINQYKTLEEMIQRCYPGALLGLEFSINDLLGYFTDIALQQ